MLPCNMYTLAWCRVPHSEPIHAPRQPIYQLHEIPDGHSLCNDHLLSS